MDRFRSLLNTFGRYVTGEVFDDHRRLRFVQYATGEQHEVRYEGEALREVMDLRTGKPTYAFETDPSGHVMSVMEPTGRRTPVRVTACEGDRLISVTGPDGAVTRYRYDDEFNLVEMTYPDGERAAFTY